jgi:hypothetical protein
MVFPESTRPQDPFHRRLGQGRPVGRRLQEQGARQRRQPAGCRLRVASLTLLHHQPRRLQLELAPIRPPLASDLLVGCTDQIPARLSRQVAK